MAATNAQDIDSEMDADLYTAANDGIRRALDEAAAGESIKSMAMIGTTTLVVAGLTGFLLTAVAIKVLR